MRRGTVHLPVSITFTSKKCSSLAFAKGERETVPEVTVELAPNLMREHVAAL